MEPPLGHGEVLSDGAPRLGVFNLIEGVVNHHLLEIHHVRPGHHQLAYDLGFLALGASLLFVGGLLAPRSSRRGGGNSTNLEVLLAPARLVGLIPGSDGSDRSDGDAGDLMSFGGLRMSAHPSSVFCRSC